MNVRYLEAGDVSWFGGGMDLTPCKEFVEDTRHFHRVLQKVCNASDDASLKVLGGNSLVPRAIQQTVL